MFPNRFELCCWFALMLLYNGWVFFTQRTQVSAAATFVLYCTWIFLLCCCCSGSRAVSMVIKLPSVLTLMCSCRGRIPPSEQCSSQVLRDKALLCSPSGDGTISSPPASVPPFFFPFALVLAPLALPVYVILLITLWEFAFLCCLLEHQLTSDFWLCGWYHDSAP